MYYGVGDDEKDVVEILDMCWLALPRCLDCLHLVTIEDLAIGILLAVSRRTGGCLDENELKGADAKHTKGSLMVLERLMAGNREASENGDDANSKN